MSTAEAPKLSRKDFSSDQDVRWCPGCGDYSILSQVQKLMPELGVARENTVFISGIGCSSRFPYYMNTYGFHTIHGRAPAIATGLKLANPDLSVWIVTGDGDALSIGGNHFIHLLRRNLDVNILLFNNEIYGLTKGQYSPTSPKGLVTKSSPTGVVDPPFNAASVAMGAGAAFVARTVDVESKHLGATLRRAAAHRGTSFVEILQNCPVFNDGCFSHLTDRDSKLDHQLVVEHGQPMRFGADGSLGIVLGEDTQPEVVEVAKVGEQALLVHDETSSMRAWLLAEMASDPTLPVPLGVLKETVGQAVYERAVHEQADAVKQERGAPDFDALYASQDTWVVES